MNKRMQKIKRIGCLAISLAMMSIPAFAATDYSSLTTEELAAMRGTMQNATEEDHNAFRHEWQERIRNMSPEERQNYAGPPENAPRYGRGGDHEPGSGMGPGPGTGSGGDGNRRGFGEGRGRR